MSATLEYLDLTLTTPAGNLACDEALLEEREEQGGSGILRVWEPSSYFVVVGLSNAVATEVNLDRCQRDEVPVLRRVSGGGTVLQGPGCLCYSLILPIDQDPALETVPGTNRWIMERTSDALAPLLKLTPGIAGHTDLVMLNRKFAGNAQKRKRRYLLFHGTLLLEMDLDLIQRYLRMPSREPDYRHGREHWEFLVNLHRPVRAVKFALRSGWNAFDRMEAAPLGRIESLVAEKYSREDWNLKR